MYKKYIKRGLDAFFAVVLLVFTSPIILLAMLILKFENKGNVIFKQKRMGKNGKFFYIYKLRSMAVDEIDGINKVTKVGKVLRNISIDELPQLLNIIKGEMSFIGPRPWIEEYNKYFSKRDKRRLEVLPGLSGWAQVQGRNDMSIKEKLAADIWYVDNISLKTDIIILFKTIGIVFKKNGASITENGIQNELDELKQMYNVEMSFGEQTVEKKIS
jgi:lipopolysaccharide/colanic/teichoic acid biosynthesis glycosyltransferase